jgi:hypothetical protein
MTRQEANTQILKLLAEYIREKPDLRFEQILSALGLDHIDFFKESTATLNKMNAFDFKNKGV